MQDQDTNYQGDEDDTTRTTSPTGAFRLRLHLAYDGTSYEGWAKQPPPAATIQWTVEKGLTKLLGQKINVVGASRTDSGVHALQQVLHFDSPRDPAEFKDFAYSLQGHLPKDIVVLEAFLAPDDFDSSWDAESKIYRYILWNGPRPSPIRRNFSHWVRRPLNVELLNQYCKIIEGFHDFASFRNAGGSAKTSTRKVLKAKWLRRGSRVIFMIHGEGFLKQMVRNLVGTMLDLEKESETPERLKAILEAKDRRKALSTAPSRGLFLARIFYPRVLDNRCRKL